MVASVGRITSAGGYDYLTRAVAKDRHDYYTGAGEAPGVWAGSGREAFELDGVVDADDMAALYGRFIDPRTAGNKRVGPDGRPLGEVTVGQALATKTRVINAGSTDEKVLEQVTAFDVTFSPAKSVSVLWAMADPTVRTAVVDAHEFAVNAGLAYLEANASHTRAGRGGVRRVQTSGFVIAKFRHRTARTTDPTRVGDPQLHTHCAILNRVQRSDGKWGTLDGKAIYDHAHAAGALYATTLEQELTRTLGVSWVTPDERVPMREIDGVSAEVCAALSSRRAQVLEHYDVLAAQWRAENGRSPTRAENAALLDDATVRSRLGKVKGDGVELHERWRASITDAQHAHIVGSLGRTEISNGGRMLAGTPEITSAVFDALHNQRSWWTRIHLFAEVARLIDPPTVEAIELEVERLVELCVDLEPDRDHEYAHLDRTKFTSTTIQQAERRILNAATAASGWKVPVMATEQLGDDQVAAVTALCAGDYAMTTVIGPAGAGKTTMLKAAAASYEQAQRPVTVLALSAVAAAVVTEETGLPADTIAAWKVGNVKLPRNGLVLIDEASMVPTLTLDQLVRVVAAYGSRIGFVGDYAQMGAPEAGGLLRDLSSEPSAVHMTAVRRFTQEWERAASKKLRQRDNTVAGTYLEQHRLFETTDIDAVESVVDAWINDTIAGLDSIIVVDTADIAADIAARCQQHLVAAGQLGDTIGRTADGNNVRVGDLIQSRKNTREMATSDQRRVLNRDVWRVTGYTDHGELIATHVRKHTTAQFTQAYTLDNIVLAYATTNAGAQGRTVDTGHALISPRTTAAAAYVAMTRGRLSNHAHVICDGHDHEEFSIGTLTARDAFAAAIVRTPEGQLSANSVQQRWLVNTATRDAERTADRHHQLTAHWWDARFQSIDTPDAAGALDGHHHRVIGILEKLAANSWAQRVDTAIAVVQWSEPSAAESFLRQLQSPAPIETNKDSRPDTNAQTGEGDPVPIATRSALPEDLLFLTAEVGALTESGVDALDQPSAPGVGERIAVSRPASSNSPTSRRRSLTANQAAAADWWTARHAKLKPRAAAALDVHRTAIVSELARRAPASWDQLVYNTIIHTDWRENSAGDAFLARLARSSRPPQAAADAAGSAPTNNATRER